MAMKKIKIIIALALPMALFAQNTGQTVNLDTLVVKPGTLMTVMSDFINTEDGNYINGGEVILHGDFTNEGITDYDQETQTGYTRFEGFSQQKIEGSVPADFYDVLFYNPYGTDDDPAFRLYGDISISGNAGFDTGIVKNDGFGGIITFENNATHSSTGDQSHVDGHVVKNGSVEFQYPIGDWDSLGTKQRFFRYAAISASEDNAGRFNAKYYYENSNGEYPHSNKVGVIELINDKEYWAVYKEGESEDVMVTLSWDRAKTTPEWLAVEPYEDIHIVRWWDRSAMGMPGIWVDEGGVVDFRDSDGETGAITTVSNVGGYGIFTLARVKSQLPLPGGVVVYNGVTPDGDGNNDYFIIDHIKNYKNRVEIYNRWGVKVFETRDYDTNGNVFRGYSEGRVTVSQNEMLPTGTYFYVIEYVYDKEVAPRTIKETGYLYLSSN